MAVKFNKKALKSNKKSQIAIGNQRFYEFALTDEHENRTVTSTKKQLQTHKKS